MNDNNTKLIRKPKCESHKDKEMSYLEWSEYAHKKHEKGEKQTQCEKCGRWLFKEEF